ncbi:23S rRNA (uracil(1939)-C(5))-methyltransferase RlmD [Zooshikella harenae]|uniref:23S rRNA (uracil(1939)-C(5))-methyltransferase RlmD n=1 Tax=Zooshikella harenae TaxID=2827238 RepID=A0ABS5Z7H2_9GAMM|nr:23S rRNA (uracil(1939)-C(5))-methyltransferase RlmD [Zooshikella harenae]MBU2709713.1 23S rRNA (uracil(1939)-C(5))-methyltransferase RlmD [Zooshikella harenae]
MKKRTSVQFYSSHSTRQKNKPLPSVTALRVEKLSHDGRGIAYWQKKPIFINGALPNELVEVDITSNRTRFLEGNVKSLLESAPSRISPECKHFAACGGCHWQFVAAEQQLVWKQQAVVEQIQRIAKTEPETLLPAICSQPWGYRQRARLACHVVKGQLQLGFRGLQSEQIVEVTHCLTLTPQLQQLLESLRALLTGLSGKRCIGHIDIAQGDAEVGIALRLIKPLPDEDTQQLEQWSIHHNVSIWLNTGTGSEPAPLRPEQPEALFYTLCQGHIQLSFLPTDFIQANQSINEAMVSQAIDWLQPKAGEALLDLFCGIGNFTLPLAQYTGVDITGIEVSASALKRCQMNAQLNGIANIRTYQADLSAQQSLSHCLGGKSFAGILLDPPRAGALAVVSQIAELKSQRVVYISCNPATLARDTAELVKHGYKLKQLGVLDMFPHTAHIESMALFTR